jgi:hypothetical protein
MRVNDVLMDYMIGIESAFGIIVLSWVFAFIQMVEKAIVGHDVVWIEGTVHNLDLALIHEIAI